MLRLASGPAKTATLLVLFSKHLKTKRNSGIGAVDRAKRRKVEQGQKAKIGAILQLAKGLGVFSAR
jgi:hypothetical protein